MRTAGTVMAPVLVDRAQAEADDAAVVAYKLGGMESLALFIEHVSLPTLRCPCCEGSGRQVSMTGRMGACHVCNESGALRSGTQADADYVRTAQSRRMSALLKDLQRSTGSMMAEMGDTFSKVSPSLGKAADQLSNLLPKKPPPPPKFYDHHHLNQHEYDVRIPIKLSTPPRPVHRHRRHGS